MSGYQDLTDRRGTGTRPNPALEKQQDCTHFFVGCSGLKIPLSFSKFCAATTERRWCGQIGRERKWQTNLITNPSSTYLRNPSPFCERQNLQGISMYQLNRQVQLNRQRGDKCWWCLCEGSLQWKCQGNEDTSGEARGMGLKDWSGLETATGLNFPFYYLQRICFSRRKRWETTSFSSVASENDSLKDDVCLSHLLSHYKLNAGICVWHCSPDSLVDPVQSWNIQHMA